MSEDLGHQIRKEDLEVVHGLSIKSEPLLNDLFKEEFLKCIQCGQILVEPLLLQCLHSVCASCLSQCTNCPNCQTPIEKSGKSIPNYFILGLQKLKESRSDSDKPCDYCRYDGKSKVAVTRCVECGDNLCEVCSDAHKKTKVTRAHSLLAFDEIRKGNHDESIRLRQRSMCNKHKEEAMNQFCHFCRTTICRECQQGEHYDHPYCSIEEAALSSRENIQLLLGALKNYIPHLEEYRSFMDDYQITLHENESSLREKIERFVRDMHESIERQKTRLLQQLNDSMGKEEEFVKYKLEHLIGFMKQVQMSSFFVDALMKHGRNDEVLPLSDVVNERLRHFLDVQLEGIPGKLVVQFIPGSSGEKSLEQMVGRLCLTHTDSGYPSVGGPPVNATEELYYQGGGVSRRSVKGSAFSVNTLLREDDCSEITSVAFDEQNIDDGEVSGYYGASSNRQKHSQRRNVSRGDLVPVRGERSKQNGVLKSHEYNPLEDHDPFSANVVLAHNQHVVKKSNYVPRSVETLPPVLDKVQLLSCFDAVSTKDTRDIWPTGVALAGTGDIYVLDRDNRCVKVFNKEGSYKFQFGGRESGEQGSLASPYDLAISSTGIVYVTDYQHEQVKCYKLSGEFLNAFSGHFKHPRGICMTNGGRFVVADCRTRQVSIHEPLEGRPVLTIRGNGRLVDMGHSDLFTDPYYVASTADNCIIVTDWAAPNLKIFDPDGDLIAQTGTYGINQEQMLQPYGVCCDDHGYIILADNANHRLHLISPNGTFIRFLITKEDDIWHPMAVCIDNKKGELIVTEALGKVKIFKYL